VTIAEFVAAALDVPFLERGRTMAGWDCYGLIVCAYREVLGVALPAYAEGYCDAARTTQGIEDVRALIRAHEGEWQRVAKPAPMDVVQITIGLRPVHVGLVVAPGQFLHAMEGFGTNVEWLRSVAYRRRIAGYYRRRPADSLPVAV